jgi:hypothetical protein
VPRAQSFFEALTATAQSFNGKFKTERGEEMLAEVLGAFPELQKSFEALAAEPFLTPGTEMPIGDQTADVGLATVLYELAEEAYNAAQRMENEKGESFFTNLKKQLFHRNEGILMTPDDVTEGELK